jgi:hypothetical protein
MCSTNQVHNKRVCCHVIEHNNQVMNVSGKRVSVNFGAVMQPASIEEVRAEITKAYTAME